MAEPVWRTRSSFDPVKTADYEFIDQPSAWKRCVSELRKTPRVAVDVEANSLHAYREKICLVQLSTDRRDFIVDPLSGIDLDPLGALLADPAVEKVFHAAEYDMLLFKGLRNWEVRNLFDTMWAGRILGFDKMGLAWFLSELYGLNLSKKHQKTNWAARPLSEEQLAYARNDTHYLLPMRDELAARLKAKGLTEEAQEIFRDIVHVEPNGREFDQEGFWQIAGTRKLSPRVLAVLRELFIYRDGEAKRRDVPSFKVLNTHMLIYLAEYAARHPEESLTLRSVPGVPDKVLERLREPLKKAVRDGLNAPVPKPVVHRRNGAPGYWQRYEALLGWRKKVARARGVESDVILGRRALQEIAERAPGTLEELAQLRWMGPYRLKRYGADILKAIT